MDRVFHFSDSRALPWIIESGKLRPHRNCDVGIGSTKYLWGTTNPQGDNTAAPFRHRHHSITMEGAWRAGLFWLVRFTLPSRGFMTWEAIKRKSKWTLEQIAELEQADRKEYGEFGHDRWRLRRRSLPLTQVLKVECTSFVTQRWRPVELSPNLVVHTRDPNLKGVRIFGKTYYATRRLFRGRVLDYQIWPDPNAPTRDDMLADEWAARPDPDDYGPDADPSEDEFDFA